MSFAAITVGLGVVAAGASIYSSVKQSKAANKIHPNKPEYQENPYATEQLGIAKQLFNGRMPGATQEEQNVFASQGNFLGNVNKNATDSSQALALGGLSQGAANQSFRQLGIDESKSKMGFLDNLNDAYRAMIGEGDKSYQSQYNTYLADVQAKTALRNAAAQNMQTGINSLGSTAFMAGQVFYPDQWGNYSKK